MHKKIIIASLIAFMINGCGTSSSQTSDLKTNGINVNETVTLSSTQFTDTVAQEEMSVSAISNGQVVSTLTVPEGTQFQSDSGEVVSDIPRLRILQSETQETQNTVDKTITTKIVTGEYKFIDEEGDKIIPTEPITISIAAPSGLQPGDEVKVTMPDIVAKKGSLQEKATLQMVDSQGNIKIVVFPTLFAGMDVVIIAIQGVIVSINVAPLTGTDGGTD